MTQSGAHTLLLTAASILKTGIPATSLTSAKSNSELISSIQNLLDHALPARNDTEEEPSYALHQDALYIPDPQDVQDEGLTNVPKDQLDVTVKFWYLSEGTEQQQERTYDPQCAIDALRRLKDTIGLDWVDTFILQVPNVVFDQKLLSEEEESRFNDSVVKVYTSIAKSSSISKMGLSEFSLPRIQRFFKTLPSATKPPRVNHINIRDSCSISDEWKKFATDQQLELYIHSDLSNLLTRSTFISLLSRYSDRLPQEISASYTRLKARWVLKYTVLYKDRSVVADKGYLVYASEL